jgi:hypothetical protein
MSRKDIRIWAFSCDSVGCEQNVDISTGDHFTISERPVQIINATGAEFVMRQFFGWTRPSKWQWFCPAHSEHAGARRLVALAERLA